MSVQGKGIVVRSSPFSHVETVRRLTHELHERGIRLFATVDHAANARTAGMEMPPTTVLIFGNPAVGTPAMLAAPDLALELPSRVLVRENADETVSVIYADPVRIGERYGLSANLVQGLSGLAHVVEAALRAGDLHRRHRQFYMIVFVKTVGGTV